MITDAQVPTIIDRVKEILTEIGKRRGIVLSVEDRPYHVEDDWLYVMVSMPQPGTHAADYSDVLAEVEKELRVDNVDNIILLPSID